jgi:hypothetical protein
MLVVDDVSVELVARAIHEATAGDLAVSVPFERLRNARTRQARAAITAFGGILP